MGSVEFVVLMDWIQNISLIETADFGIITG